MRVSGIYVRFYRAFNFDYMRKLHRDVDPNPWDDYRGKFYPYVKVQLDDQITCVVGANESGKSQLLRAVDFALGNGAPVGADFCRYSKFFTVDSTQHLPHFGVRIALDPVDLPQLREVLGDVPAVISHVHIFRECSDVVKVYVGDSSEPVEVSATSPELRSFLPKSFSIDPEQPIPDSVPIDYLVAKAGSAEYRPGVRRAHRWKAMTRIGTLADALSNNGSTIDSIRKAVDFDVIPQPSQEELLQWDLAYDLLVTVGGVDGSTFAKLSEALQKEKEGYASGLVHSMNQQLAEALNLRRWWTQDSHFSLQVQPRDFELVFTIRDRTASEYSFAERSFGLKYFLSYLVQYLRHVAKGAPATLLLMDEPDAFLSNQGQQDLLRLFQDYVDQDRKANRQVVFVTHSPFLIDKNRADRVRVLDKGTNDEGTRVVRDVARNHFEPLRSAFGGFVAETTFIGNCNIMLEGPSDQVYLAGMSSEALRRGTTEIERLDLNSVTLVNCSSASQMPYMIFLARGRNKKEQPAIIALLDGDAAGQGAAKDIAKGYGRGALLDQKFVFPIAGENLPDVKTGRKNGPKDIEDLVPTSLLLRACQGLAEEIGLDPEPIATSVQIDEKAVEDKGHLAAVREALRAAGHPLRPDKVGLARQVVRLVEAETAPDVEAARNNFRALFMKLTELQRRAETERSERGVGERVNREIGSFLKDHEQAPKRAELKVFLDKVTDLLDTSDEAEEIRMRIRVLQNRHDLSVDLPALVKHWTTVADDIAALRYAARLASEDPHPPDTPRSGTARQDDAPADAQTAVAAESNGQSSSALAQG